MMATHRTLRPDENPIDIIKEFIKSGGGTLSLNEKGKQNKQQVGGNHPIRLASGTSTDALQGGRVVAVEAPRDLVDDDLGRGGAIAS